MTTRTEFELYKRQSIKAAKELCYSKETLEMLRRAKSVSEVERIMVDARKGRI